jgi:hypothetical protein
MKRKVMMVSAVLVSLVMFLTGCSSVHYFPKDKYFQAADGRYVKTIVEIEF